MEIVIKRTDSGDIDYQILIPILDAELEQRDGKEEHVFYAAYNKSDDIKHVVVAYLQGMPIGCGAIKAYEGHTVEVKRMFVHKDYRGKGIAGRVLQELEKWAAELHFTSLILETGIGMPEAISLYKKKGYDIISNYGQYVGKEMSVCMQKNINKDS